MKEWYKNRVVQVLFHVAGWIVFFSLPPLLRPEFQHVGNHIVRPPFFTTENLIAHGFLVVLFYLNAYYLIPRFLNRKKITTYIILVMLIFTVSFLVTFAMKRIQEYRIYNTSISPVRPTIGPDFQPRPAFPDLPPPRTGRMVVFHFPLIFSFFSVIFVLAVSTAYRFILDKLRMEKLQQMRQNEHLKTELSFLRSQISPHFMFNILNSAVSLARLKSDQLEPMLIKLSNLLRYMLYNADDEKMPLTQELEYLESYIDLQKLRFEEDVEITFVKSGIFFGYGIEPMLLIPFVENAFKHGIAHINKPNIFIELREENGILNFHVKNRYGSLVDETQDKNSGIGLANVKKRLSLLYDDKYSLDVKVDSEWFDVNLTLVLK